MGLHSHLCAPPLKGPPSELSLTVSFRFFELHGAKYLERQILYPKEWLPNVVIYSRMACLRGREFVPGPPLPTTPLDHMPKTGNDSRTQARGAIFSL